MRTVIQNTFGGPEVLEIVEAARPVPQAGELLVRVHASGLNPVDAAWYAQRQTECDSTSTC